MPKGLTDKQEIFAKLYAKTDDAQYASTKAGYASPLRGYIERDKPTVRARVSELRARAKDIIAESLPGVASEHVRRTQDKNVTDRSFIGLSTLLYKVGGMLQEGAEENKETHEMTRDEMLAKLASLEGRSEEDIRGALAHPVKPVIEAESGSVFD